MLPNKDNNMKNNFILNNLLFMYIIMILLNFISSYYIIPFKYLNIPLSDLYNIHSDIAQEEIFLNYTNNITLYSLLKINNSHILQAFLDSKDICSTFSENKCISTFNLTLNLPNNHINQNISQIMDKFYENNKINSEDKNCISTIFGFGFPQTILSSNCISLIEQIKANDNTARTYTWSINYFNKSQKSEYNYDGQIIIGIEPHEYQPNIFNISNYKTIYSYEDSDNYYLNKKSEYCIKFDSIYFFNNTIISSENMIKCTGPASMDGYFRFNNGMIQSSYEYFYLIKKYFFDKYIIVEICKEIIFSKYYHTFVCDKNKLDIVQFYKMFPTLYFKNVDLNYIFELNANDLFKEKNKQIYFMIYCNELMSLKWVFGEIFLKKYYFTFNQNDKLIGFYAIMNPKDEIKNNNNNENDKKDNNNSYTGIILIIIGGLILLFEIIVAIMWIWKKKFGNNRRKRANELNDDNYDYLTDNSENKQILDNN